MDESQSARSHSELAAAYDDTYDDRYWDIARRVEWSRLGPHLPPKGGRALDAGGGTGEFAIELVQKGYDVVLTDLSAGMLDVARTKVGELGIADQVTILQQDICDMGALDDGSFDLVISLGDPVSYCADREAAVGELSRVAKRGAPVMATVDSFFHQMVEIVREKRSEELDRLERTGRTRFPAEFPQHNFRAGELKELFERHGLEVVEVFGIHVIADKLGRADAQRLLADRDIFERIVELELRYCTEPSIVGAAGHLGIIGRKV